MYYLVIDFGTTSTKSALVHLDSGRFHDLRRHTPGLPARTEAAVKGRHELSLSELLERFNTICAQAWKQQRFDGIVLCSEMHGFVVLDEAGAPQTDYVSWLDARSLERLDDGPSTHDLMVERLGEDFRQITGMRPRPGFPLLNLAHTARAGALHVAEGWVLSLPAALAVLSHDTQSVIDGGLVEHPTMLAAMALADVNAGSAASPHLLSLVADIGGFRPRLGAVCSEGAIAGHWPGPEGPIPIHAGVGDHQCSVLGASPAPVCEANLNLGTGSQVGIIDGPRSSAFELRPYFDARHLTAVTHIPAGRALNEYIGFLDSVAASTGTTGDFWRALAEIRPEQVAAAALRVDLAIFEGARGWQSGGTISGIVEGSLDLEAYLAAILRAFVDQYVNVLAELDPSRQLSRLVLSGGIARQLPHLQQMLAAATTAEVLPAVALDESLLGLRTIALHAAGRAPTVAAAAAMFGRQCEITDDPAR